MKGKHQLPLVLHSNSAPWFTVKIWRAFTKLLHLRLTLLTERLCHLQKEPPHICQPTVKLALTTSQPCNGGYQLGDDIVICAPLLMATDPLSIIKDCLQVIVANLLHGPLHHQICIDYHSPTGTGEPPYFVATLQILDSGV